MAAKQDKRYFIIMLVIIVASILGCMVFLIQMTVIAGDNHEQLPIRRLRVTINKDQWEMLFDQCRKFTAKHQLQYDLSFYESSGGENFQVWMARKDVEIILRDRPKSSTEAVVWFYDTNRYASASPEIVDGLVIDLIDFIREIPNVTITEEK